MKKRGELTTKQIVALIILIVSFAVILYFIFALDLGQTTDEEICRNSVVLRSNAVLPGGSVSLDCKQRYVCITGDGSCEQMTNPKKIEVESEEEVYLALAEEMRACWWMFGEGTLNYVGDDFTHNNYCSICAQIAFDDSLRAIEAFSVGVLDKDRLYDFLTENTIQGSDETYSEYIFDVESFDSLRASISEEHGKGGTFGEVNLAQQHYVVMGIVSEVDGWVETAAVVGAGIGIVAVSIFTGGISAGAIVGGIVAGGVSGGVAGGVAGEISDSIDPEIVSVTVEGKGIDNVFMVPTIIEARSDNFELLDCEEVTTLS